MAQFNFPAIGTSWRIDIDQVLSVELEASLLIAIKKRIDIFDQAYSRFRADSLVTKMSKQIGDFTLPSDAKPMLELYRDLYNRTGGLVTPLVGNILADAGYDANYSLVQARELQVAPTWDEVMDYQFPVLTIKKPVLLDFGAVGKGYLVDLVSEVIEGFGIYEYCVDAGGDIFHKGTESIRVGLENPDNTEQVIGVCELGNGSICGSAGHRRAWGKFTHIINPQTLLSPVEVVAVWVTASSALLADALTTCLFFVPAETLLEVCDFDYVLIKKDRSIEKSVGFVGEIFT